MRNQYESQEEHDHFEGAMEQDHRNEKPKNDLTREMEKTNKEFFEKFGADKIWVKPSKENVETIHKIWELMTEAMHSIRKEAQLELIEEIKNALEKEKPISTLGFRLEGEALETYMRYRGYNEARAEIKDLLTTKEESLKEELN